MTADQELDRVVAWLRGPVWSRMSLIKRLHFALGMVFVPEKVGSAFARNFADALARHEHRSEADG